MSVSSWRLPHVDAFINKSRKQNSKVILFSFQEESNLTFNAVSCTECSFNFQNGKEANQSTAYSAIAQVSNHLKQCLSGLLKMSLCFGRFCWSLSLHRFGKENKSCGTEHRQWRIVLWTARKEWGNLVQNSWVLQGLSWLYRVVKSADRTGSVRLGASKLKLQLQFGKR